MRGKVDRQETMLTLMTPSRRVPADHPIRRIKEIADAELARLSEVFDEMYSVRGRYSIPPERLLKASVLIALYSVRSERQLCEQLEYNLLFRFFLDMGNDEVVFDASSFAKNRERLMSSEVARLFFEGVVRKAKEKRLISTEHFTVDGTQIEAWASLKSFRRKEGRERGGSDDDDRGNPTVDFHGERRSNETHESRTDPEARLLRKGPGKEARLSFLGHVVMENRHGLCVDLSVSKATGWAEREQALRMVERLGERGIRVRTLGADKGYDTRDFVAALREEGITAHVAQNSRGRRPRIDGRTTRHPGYELSQRCRKRVEEIFGWAKTVGGLRKTRYRGVARTELWTYVVGAAYNLVRLAKLLPASAGA